MTCERVIIINNGKIVAVDSPENLTRQLSGGQRIEVKVSGPMEQLLQVINHDETLISIHTVGNKMIKLCGIL